MPNANGARAAIAIFAAVMLGIAALTGGSLDKNFLRWASAAASVVVLILLIYEKWAWRWPLIRKGAEWAGKPIIHGTWKGELHYERDANDQPGSIPFYMAVDQTFSTVRVRSFVRTSESNSMTAAIDRPAPKRRQLVFAYRSEAPHHARDGNRPHDGTSVLNLAGIPVVEIRGSYYTDRLRRGEIVFAEHAGKVAESFSQAELLDYKPLAALSGRSARSAT